MLEGTHPAGGAGGDDIPGHQGEVPGDEGQDLFDGKDHVAGVGVLDGPAVEAAADCQILGIADVF